uniref:YsnF/AvaK domain-containing protein n=1 Tax=Dyadobacter sp. TaxID=1914288 RepID=UPI003F6FEE5F
LYFAKKLKLCVPILAQIFIESRLTTNQITEIMSSTVIGIFEQESQAQQAKQYLLDNGYKASQVDLSAQPADYKADQSLDDDSDGIGGFFKNLFSDDDEKADRFSKAGRRGTVVTVHALTNQEAEVAADILDDHGAVDVDEFGQMNQAFDNTLIAPQAGSISDVNDNKESISVIEEQMQVGKREVQTGGVRLRSRIIERPVEERIRLRQEHVSVTRSAANRPATEADFDAFKEGTIELTEHEEVAVVSKQAFVVEEVSLQKEIEEKEETVKGTVRKTEVDVEEIPSSPQNRKYDEDLR